jgi:CysZ protein
MRYFRQFQAGFLSFGTAVLMIFRSNMWMAFSVPLFLLLGLKWLSIILNDDLDLVSFKHINDSNPEQYLVVGLKSIGVYLFGYMDKYMVLTLLAPLLTGLSAHTEFMLTGNKYKYSLSQYVTDVQRALVIAFRNMGILMGCMMLYYGLTLIITLPDVAANCFYYAIAFYFYGFSFMDYASERRRLTVSEAVAFTRQHAVTAYALGAIYGLLFLIPWAGVVIAPILGAVAGTIAVHELVDLRTNQYAIRREPVVPPDPGGTTVEAAETAEAVEIVEAVHPVDAVEAPEVRETAPERPA